MTRINYLWTLWEEFNDTEFGGKLEPIPLLLKRFSPWRKDGQLQWTIRNGKRIALSLEISDAAYKDEDDLQGCMLHEMIHQYQCQVMNVDADHDAVFNSIARKLERKHGISVR